MNSKCDKLEKSKKACRFKNIHDVGICTDISLCQSGNCAVNDSDFKKIVEKAFYPRDGKRDSHQYRIETKAYRKYKRKIKKMALEIMEANDFDEILDFATFKDEEHIFGIGELTEYDIAFRIGKALGKCPDKLYLHAGTKEGAKKAGFNVNKEKFLTLETVISKLHFLKDVPMCQIENFLCVCKDDPSEKSFICYQELHLNKE